MTISKENYQTFERKVLEQSYWIHLQLELNNSKNAIPKHEENQYDKIIQEELESIDDLLKYSEEKIKEENLMDNICPALKSVSDDLKDIIVKCLPVLIPFSFIESPKITYNLLLYAGICIVIFRAGVKTICKNYDQDENRE